MKKLFYILLNLLILNTFKVFAIDDATFDISNSGTVSNFGTINFKKGSVTTNLGEIQNNQTKDSSSTKVVGVGHINVNDQAMLQSSSGQILNDGVIYSLGTLTFSQPTINGDVIYEHKTDNKLIPQASYFNIKFLGDGKKILNENKPLTSRNHFYTDGGAPLRWDQNLANIKIFVKDSIDFNGSINPFDRSGQIIMDGIKGQNVRGNGTTFLLELDNVLGADIQDTTSDNSKKDGLKVSHLVLTKGQLRNSANANITIDASSSTMSNLASGTITRTALGSLAFEPKYTSNVELQYVGAASELNIVTGPEVPQLDKSKLQNLLVENVDGVTLGSSATVSNRVFVNSTLRTYQKSVSGKDSLEHELLMTSNIDPEYSNNYAEVDGKFTRNNLKNDGSAILFNNKFSFARFNDVADVGNIKKLSFDIRKATPWNEDYYTGSVKIQRTLIVSADSTKDGATDTNFVGTGSVDIRFGWRNDNNNLSNINLNEVWADAQTPEAFETLHLARWEEIEHWVDVLSSKNLVDSTDVKWAYIEGSIDATLGKFGKYSVGYPANGYIKFYAKAIMQGPFKTAKDLKDIMFTNLRDKNLIPLTPPNIYPYNLDDKSQFIKVTSIPKNVVDWVVLEMRDKAINPSYRYFKTCYLNKSGDLIDPLLGGHVALSQVSVSSASTNLTNDRMDTTGQTEYYFAIRHKNHLTLMSQNPVKLNYKDGIALKSTFDFSRSDSIFGSTSNMRLLGYDVNKTAMFGMIAGNFPAEFDLSGEIKDANPISKFFLDGLEGMDEIKSNDYNVISTFFKDNKFPLGYFTEDYDLNGIVNTKDYNISWNNRDKNVTIK